MAQKFTSSNLLSDMKGKPAEYLEFLRVASLNSGIYHLAAGTEDPQQPHDADEIYYTLKGQAKFESDGEIYDVSTGTILFVAAEEEHRFFDIEEDLDLLVFFAGES